VIGSTWWVGVRDGGALRCFGGNVGQCVGGVLKVVSLMFLVEGRGSALVLKKMTKKC
jgi:hypothetical protein